MTAERQTDQKHVKIRYRPREQFRSFHNRKQRWSVLVCHRRAGKTVATLNDLIRGAVNECKPEGRYAFIFPQRNQAKDTAWRYLRRYAEPLLGKPPNESELRVDLVNGSMIRLYGADNPDALRGPYLDGVVLDEFADMKPEVWHEVVRPMLADRRGWATFIGTPKGKNEFFLLYQNAQKDEAWFHMILKASASGIIAPTELADLRREMGEDQYQQEFECAARKASGSGPLPVAAGRRIRRLAQALWRLDQSVHARVQELRLERCVCRPRTTFPPSSERCSFEAAIKGAFYSEEMRAMLAEERIRPIKIGTDVRVHTAWDLGVSDSTAIWFVQCVGRERRLVDYYEGSGVGLGHYAQVLHDKRIQHGWKYGDHYFPHDIKIREFSSGQSRLQSLAALGIDAIAVPQSNVLDGINLTRRMLGRTWIDCNRCERGIEALRQYRREYDDRLKDWRKNPLHDWTSHAADALRTFACGFDDGPVGSNDPRGRGRQGEPPPRGTFWSA
jgi:phage terminase large subunit